MCQLASGPVCVGHRLLDQHFAQRDGERERKLYCRASQGHMELGGGTSRSLFPLCYLYLFFLFPPLIVLDFLWLLATLSRFFALTPPPLQSALLQSPAAVRIPHQSFSRREIRSFGNYFF